MNKINFDYSQNRDINYLTNIISDYLKDHELNTFNIGFTYNSDTSIEEKMKLKTEFQEPLIESLETNLNIKRDLINYNLEIIIDFTRDTISFSFKPIFVYGIYNKYSRTLPQTIYYCFKCKGRGCKNCNNTGRLANESIQEIIGKYFEDKFGATDNKFHGSGREDVDVLMLGNGREFVTELINPKKRTLSKEEFNLLEEKVNSENKDKISIKELKITNKEKVVEIKNTPHKKRYQALVTCEESIESNDIDKLKDFNNVIEQKTPQRVKKRRADIIRSRHCKVDNIELINNNSFKIDLTTDAGLYIKEFISGDDNRSNPSISSLLNKKCVCSQLDVIGILRN